MAYEHVRESAMSISRKVWIQGDSMNDRHNVIREVASLVASSKEAPTSVAYAIAREIWTVYWKETETAVKPEITSVMSISRKA